METHFNVLISLPGSGSLTIEEAFGWMKTIESLRKSHFVGHAATGWAFTFAAAYNPTRLPALMAEAA